MDYSKQYLSWADARPVTGANGWWRVNGWVIYISQLPVHGQCTLNWDGFIQLPVKMVPCGFGRMIQVDGCGHLPQYIRSFIRRTRMDGVTFLEASERVRFFTTMA